jgi:hypothetical protein
MSIDDVNDTYNVTEADLLIIILSDCYDHLQFFEEAYTNKHPL